MAARLENSVSHQWRVQVETAENRWDKSKKGSPIKLRKQHSLRSSGTSSIFVVDQLEPYFQLNLSTKSPLLSKPHCNNGFSCFVSETKELVAFIKQNSAAKIWCDSLRIDILHLTSIQSSSECLESCRSTCLSLSRSSYGMMVGRECRAANLHNRACWNIYKVALYLTRCSWLLTV